MISPAQIAFDAAAHAYHLNGHPVPSVTQILEQSGLSGNIWWTEAARRRGTAVHKVALLLSNGAHGQSVEEIIGHSRWDPAFTAPAIVPYGVACAKFYLSTGLKPELVEERVASAKFQICGTLDLFGALPDGRTMLVDLKSGDPQDAAWLQTAGYCMLLEESHAIKPDLRTVVWLKPDGEFKMWPPKPSGGDDLAIFCQAANVYHWRRAHRML